MKIEVNSFYYSANKNLLVFVDHINETDRPDWTGLSPNEVSCVIVNNNNDDSHKEWKESFEKHFKKVAWLENHE